jgi:2-iminobutanoate/2-iminopropanoate deaminase
MIRKSVVSGLLPAALGPYSHAIVAGGFVFCSGTAGIDPATGTVRDGIEAQTEQALRNLAVILQAAGASTADLIKTTIGCAMSCAGGPWLRHDPAAGGSGGVGSP